MTDRDAEREGSIPIPRPLWARAEYAEQQWDIVRTLASQLAYALAGYHGGAGVELVEETRLLGEAVTHGLLPPEWTCRRDDELARLSVTNYEQACELSALTAQHEETRRQAEEITRLRVLLRQGGRLGDPALADAANDDLLTRAEQAEAQARVLREALQRLYDETADYIRINHLGNVHHNRSMQMARDALATPPVSHTHTQACYEGKCAPQPPASPPSRIECASCHRSPTNDEQIALVRKNVKGVKGVFLCQWCDASVADQPVPPSQEEQR